MNAKRRKPEPLYRVMFTGSIGYLIQSGGRLFDSRKEAVAYKKKAKSDHPQFTYAIFKYVP